MIRRAALTLLALISSAASAYAQEKITLRVADVYPEGHYIANATVKPWMDKVKQKLGDRIAFEYFPAEQLGKGRDLLAFTQNGVVDVGLVIPAFVPDQLPLSAVGELPGLFSTACQGSAAFWKLAHDGLLAQKEYDPNNIHILFETLLPPYQIMSRQPIGGVKSFEGRKLYSTGGAKDLTLRKLGAVPIRMTTAEVYKSMSRGTIDGGVMSYATALAYRLPGLIKSATQGENFGSGVVTYAISLNRWRKLPDEVRKAMEDSGDEVTREACVAFDHGVSADIDTLRKDGVELTPMSDADHAEIAKATTTVANQWADELEGRGKPGKAVLDAFHAALENQ